MKTFKTQWKKDLRNCGSSSWPGVNVQNVLQPALAKVASVCNMSLELRCGFVSFCSKWNNFQLLFWKREGKLHLSSHPSPLLMLWHWFRVWWSLWGTIKPLLYPVCENASHQILLLMQRSLGVDSHLLVYAVGWRGIMPLTDSGIF